MNKQPALTSKACLVYAKPHLEVALRLLCFICKENKEASSWR